MSDERNWHDERRERTPSVMTKTSFESQLLSTVEKAIDTRIAERAVPKRKFEWNNVYARNTIFTPFELVGMAVIFVVLLTIYLLAN
jgi:hypothetical protein